MPESVIHVLSVLRDKDKSLMAVKREFQWCMLCLSVRRLSPLYTRQFSCLLLMLSVPKEVGYLVTTFYPLDGTMDGGPLILQLTSIIILLCSVKTVN